MSVVTNLLLSFDILEREQDRMGEGNTFPFRHGSGLLDMARGEYGGTKSFELPLWGGAFNHLDFDALMKHLRTKVNWEYPEHVRIMVAEQEDAAYRMAAL